MSVSNVVVKQTYLADGVTTQFAIPFAFFPSTAETVTKVYTINRTTGVKTLKVIGALNDYTLPHDVNTEPAFVVFNVAPGNVNPALTVDVQVVRELPLVQSIAFINSGKMLLTNIQSAVDYLTLLLQQVNEATSRAVRVSDLDSLAAFDPTFAPGLTDPANAGKTLIIRSLGGGFDLGLSAADIQTALTAAQAAAVSAANSSNAAAASANTASTQATNGSASATAAAASAAAAAVSAAAAAASAASGAGQPVAQTTVTEGSTSTLSGDTNNSAVNNMVDYSGRIKRGTTVFSRVSFSIFFRNGAWELAFGEERWNNADSGVTWTVDPVTGTPSATVPTDGRGSAILDLKKLLTAI